MNMLISYEPVSGCMARCMGGRSCWAVKYVQGHIKG